MSKHIILSYLIPYLKKKEIPYKKFGKTIMVKCPFCEEQKMSANVIPNTNLIKCLSCNKKYTILDLATVFDFEVPPTDDQEVYDYLIKELNIELPTQAEKNKVEEILNFYEKNEFDLVRIIPNGKIPVEKNWTNKYHKNKEEWVQWLDENANLGIKTGKISGITVIDIDTKPIPKEIEKIMGKTLIQETTKGFHLFYKYDSDFPKTRIDEFQIDLENDGGQVVSAPSKINGIVRKIELNNIIEMPNELKKLLINKVTKPKKTFSEEIIEGIQTEDFKINPKDFELVNNNLEGCCNSSFIKLGGILRKRLNPQQTGYVLHILNRHLLENPMNDQAINAMIRELENYTFCDESEMAEEILKYLKDTELASKAEIEMAIIGERAKGEQRKRIDKTLLYLLKEDKIVKRGRNYEIIKAMEWNDALSDIDKPLNFKVPYFEDYAYLNVGDKIILGGRNKTGKTYLAMNFIKRIVSQGIKPDYIYNESGNRFAKTARILGLKDGDFNHVFCSDPDKIILRPNAITIYDWVKPNDFAKTDDLFSGMVEKLNKTQGFMICFVQLKEDDTFFAKNQIGQFPAILARYLYEDESDGTYTKIKLDYVRDAKIKGKKFEIPCIYNWDTREVKLIEEIEGKN